MRKQRHTLRELRESSGLTPEQVCAALGRSRAWLYAAETGRAAFTLTDIQHLAELYGLPVSEMVAICQSAQAARSAEPAARKGGGR